MGYTHHWRWEEEATKKEFREYIREVADLVAHGRQAGILGDPMGVDCAAILTNNGVGFNGIGEDAHESFVFDGVTGDFCKTNRKPYDVYVCAALILAGDHWPESTLEISSDGNWHGFTNLLTGEVTDPEDEWVPARKPYEAVYGREPTRQVVE